MSNDDMMPVPPLPPIPEDVTAGKYRLALIIDDVVHSILILEPAEAARYLSNPTFVQIPRTLHVSPGARWDGEKFITNS